VSRAAVQNADETVGNGAQCLVVRLAAAAVIVVETTHAG
jgi:hypothetical protein